MHNLVGQSLGQYKVISLIGEGGMAAVYRARQESINRDVAIKVIKTNLLDMEDFLQRFQREAQTVASLSHAHILKVFDYGRHEDIVYLVMELLTGGSLDSLIRKGPMPLPRAAAILDQITSALDYAHQKGIIHRDLKPENVLLDEAGNAFLTDFGLAKLLQSELRLTQSGAAMGTPAYMSPEQWRGQPLDARSDVYALGVVLFEMLSGSLPFKGDTSLSMMYLHINEPPPALRTLRPDLPVSIEALVLRALAKEPNDRFPSAGQLAAEFRDAIAGKPAAKVSQKVSQIAAAAPPHAAPLIQAPTAPKTAQPAPASSSSLWRWVVLGAALLAVVGIAAGFGSRLLQPPPLPTLIQTATPTIDNDTPVAQTLAARLTLTANAIASYTATPTHTATGTATLTPTATVTATLTSTVTASPTRTLTATPSVTATLTYTASPTRTATFTRTSVSTRAPSGGLGGQPGGPLPPPTHALPPTLPPPPGGGQLPPGGPPPGGPPPGGPPPRP